MPKLKFRTNSIFLLIALFLFTPGSSEASFWDDFWGGGNIVVEIDDRDLTDVDFQDWWREWQDPQTPVPETPDEFIDWMLLAREAEQMQFHDNPSFRGKMNVFLKVRSLMMLRSEEIGERLLPATDAQLDELYQGTYAPFLNLRMVALASEDEVSVIQNLLNGGLPLKEAAEQAGFNDPERFIEETGEMRPNKAPEPLREVALTLEPGQVSSPVVWKEVYYFIEVLSRRDGTKDDFQSVRENLVKKYRKNEDIRLTTLLIKNLKEKHKIEIDYDFLSGMQSDGVAQGEEDRIVIKFGETEITAGRVFQGVKKQLELPDGVKIEGEKFQKARDRVVNTIVTQSLLGVESLARHYEQRAPLKSTYEFYRQNRLIKELEREVIRPQIKIEEADIIKEYEAHPDRYIKQKNLVDLLMVDTKSEKLAKVLGDQLKAGGDFGTIMKVLAPDGMDVQRKSVEGLVPEIREAVSSLAPGKSAGPISSDGKMHFVKFIGRVDRVMFTLEEVNALIKERLEEEKYTEVRNNYLQRLKQNSKIKINNSVWKKTRRQLLEKTDAKN